MKKKQTWKVFDFSKEGKSYKIKAGSKKEASQFLIDEYNIDIKDCIEVLVS